MRWDRIIETVPGKAPGNLMVFWIFLGPNFYFKQRKVEQKLANGNAEQLFGKSAA